MYYGKRALITTWLLSIFLGVALHFLYGWLPSAATALFSPVNESLWEHVKLVYWPLVLAALWISRGRPGGARPWLLVLPGVCALLLLLGYLYHITLGGEALWVDAAIYVAVMTLGFWLPTRCSGPFSGVKWLLPVFGALALAILIGFFTLWPPEHILFVDLSAANVWARLPC